MADVQICPYCKKQFKRLKSHLPHCKLARLEESRDVLSSGQSGCDSITPKFQITEKSKRKRKSTEIAFEKENKESKSALVKSKSKANSIEALGITKSATRSNLHTDEETQKQSKCIVGNTQRRECSSPKALTKVRAQPGEVFSESKLVKKSKSKTVSDETQFVTGVSSDPLNQSAKFCSEAHTQRNKSSPKRGESKTGSAQQSAFRWPDYAVADHLSDSQRQTDTTEVETRNHARVRNKFESFAEDLVPYQKTGCEPVKSVMERGLADGQQHLTIIETVVRVKNIGLELTEDISNRKSRNIVSTIKASGSDSYAADSSKKVTRVSPELALRVESITAENSLFCKLLEDPKETPFFRNSKLSMSGMSFRPSLPMLKIANDRWLVPPERLMQPSPLGLEWFPELYPNYHRLGLFSRKQLQWTTRISEGWNGYNNRHITVKKGGVVGVSVLLLSYIFNCVWSYGQIKEPSR